MNSSIVLELVCKYCTAGKCTKHLSVITKYDKITGLEIEARCICTKCNVRGGK